jgi:hypothetical protein
MEARTMTTTPEKADIVDRLEARLRAHTPTSLPSYIGQEDGGAILRDCREAATEIAALRRELEEAREALEPFAEAAHSYDPNEGDGDDIAWSHDFTIGSLRRARAAIRNLAGEKADG